LTLCDKLKKISESISKKIEKIKTEEATKNAFIMPFIFRYNSTKRFPNRRTQKIH